MIAEDFKAEVDVDIFYLLPRKGQVPAFCIMPLIGAFPLWEFHLRYTAQDPVFG